MDNTLLCTEGDFWIANDSLQKILLKEPGQERIRIFTGKNTASFIDIYGINKQEVEANAHLITGAKDLYHATLALIELIKQVEPLWKETDAYDIAIKALSKANPDYKPEAITYKITTP